MKRSGPVLTISVDGRNERFEELAYLQVKLNPKHSQVTVQVLRLIQKNPVICINLKGSATSVISTCGSSYSKQILVQETERMAQIGYNIQTFCFKELNKEDSAQLKKKIDAVSMYSKTSKAQLAKAIQEHLTNMSIVGTLGLQKTVPLRNSLTVQDLTNNRVKVWLLSQYTHRTAITNCANLELLSEESERFELKGRNDREIEDSIRMCFNAIFDSEQKELQKE